MPRMAPAQVFSPDKVAVVHVKKRPTATAWVEFLQDFGK